MVPVLVPPVAVNATIEPPVARLLPAASRAWRVNVAVPPERTVPAEGVTVDCVVEIGPGVTWTVGNGVEVTLVLLIVAWIVTAVQARTPV